MGNQNLSYNHRGYNKLPDPPETQELTTMPPPLHSRYPSDPRIQQSSGYVSHGDQIRQQYYGGQQQHGNPHPHMVIDDWSNETGFVSNGISQRGNASLPYNQSGLSHGDQIRHQYYGKSQNDDNPFGDLSTGLPYPSDGQPSPRPPVPLKDEQKGPTSYFITDKGYNESADGKGDEKEPRKPLTKYQKGRTWFERKTGGAFFCWLLSVVQLCVFFGELGHYGKLVGQPIETKPSFNWMIGPSIYSLVNMGARYQPCMRAIPNVQNASELISWPCPNSTSSDFTCSLSQLCGKLGSKVPTPQPGVGTYDQPGPNQWLRLFTPIFLHVGLLHIGFNLLVQLTVGRQMEQAMGHGPFLGVYFLSGIFGFLLGANFAGTNQASMGASGSIFGLLAINILVILYNGNVKSKWKDLLYLGIEILITLILGLIPGVDNFSHIGGLLMGFCSGVILMRTPVFFDGRQGAPIPGFAGFMEMIRNSRDFRDKSWKWWTWFSIRIFAFVLAVLAFILLIKNFYVWHGTCSWCKHLSCLPWGDYCKKGDLEFTLQTTTTTSPAGQKRAAAVVAREFTRRLARAFTG